jgi:hypothetical protein
MKRIKRMMVILQKQEKQEELSQEIIRKPDKVYILRKGASDGR